jgi:anti-sigma regulatory factor (Ser/Thr protein kinase)
VVTAPFATTVEGLAGLSALRRSLGGWMTSLGVDDVIQSELVLAVTELATNGIEASPDERSTVTAEQDPEGALRIVVLNDGPPFDGRPDRGPSDVLSARGRGLDLAAAFVDSLAFGTVNGCTEATVVKRLR